LLLLGLGSGCLFWESLVGEPLSLWVINTTNRGPLTIRLDGEVVVKALPSTAVESRAAARRIALDEGAHRVEARTPDGAVVDSAEFRVREKSHGFLFAPAHGADACFVLVRTAYGDSRRAGGQPLSPEQSFWEMPFSIDRWFEASPAQMPVQSGSTGAHDDAVRMLPCQDGALVHPLEPLR
jgi:hypothetical protein